MRNFVILEWAVFGAFFIGDTASALVSRWWGPAPKITIGIFSTGAAVLCTGAILIAAAP